MTEKDSSAIAMKQPTKTQLPVCVGLEVCTLVTFLFRCKNLMYIPSSIISIIWSTWCYLQYVIPNSYVPADTSRQKSIFQQHFTCSSPCSKQKWYAESTLTHQFYNYERCPASFMTIIFVLCSRFSGVASAPEPEPEASPSPSPVSSPSHRKRLCNQVSKRDFGLASDSLTFEI